MRFAILLLLAGGMAACDVPGDPRPGLWEETSTFAGKTDVQKFCLTSGKTVRELVGSDSCDDKNLRVAGGSISGTLMCTGGWDITRLDMGLSGSYGTSHIKLRSKMKLRGTMLISETRMRRRSGDCDNSGEWVPSR